VAATGAWPVPEHQTEHTARWRGALTGGAPSDNHRPYRPHRPNGRKNGKSRNRVGNIKIAKMGLLRTGSTELSYTLWSKFSRMTTIVG
jgi:hypothetical protein